MKCHLNLNLNATLPIHKEQTLWRKLKKNSTKKRNYEFLNEIHMCGAETKLKL